jgi:hypothetical protein
VVGNNDRSRRKIDSSAKGESVLWRKKIAPADKPPERFREIRFVSLADLGAEKFAVALKLYFSAAEQISHSRNGLLGVAGAGTDGEDQIAE